MNFPKLILASQSPRRSQLLREAGFDFVVKTNPVEENHPPDTLPQDIPAFLAHKKAKAAIHFIEQNEIIIAADSIVIQDGVIFEKPKDRNDAVRMLKALSGSQHEVITGVCLLTKEKVKTFSGRSVVYFEELSDEEIDYYIDHYKPFDKAGSYGVQEWLGFCKIHKIEGTYTNVMGLPVDLVYKHLKNF